MRNFRFLPAAVVVAFVSSPAAAEPEPQIFGPRSVLPSDDEVIPTNAILWAEGGPMGQSSVVICDDVDGEAYDCGGEVLPAFERVAINGSADGTELWSATLGNLQPGSGVLIDIFSGFDHISRRYFVGDDEDTTPPTVPVQLLADEQTSYSATRGRIRIAWDNATDDVGIAYYAVFVKTADDERFVGARFAFPDIARHVFYYTPERDQVVVLSVHAVDLAGNSGPRVDTAPIFIPATSAADFACRCTTVPTSSPFVFALFLLALTPLLRRRFQFDISRTIAS